MYLLLDIGGTNTRMAYSATGESFEEPIKFETPRNFDVAVDLYKTHGKTLIAGRELKAIGAGVKFLNGERTGMLEQALLPDWAGRSLAGALEDAFGVPARLENDTAIVGLGEVHYGAGQGHRMVVYMTVSTGVGGVSIVDGKIDDSTYGFEPGHQIVNAFERVVKCPSCGTFGDLESYVSGVAFERRYGKKAYEVHDSAIWDEAAHILAVGLNNVIVTWSPECIVVGGSMLNNRGISIDKTCEYLKDILKIFPECPQIKKAELDDIGGLFGALAFLDQ